METAQEYYRNHGPMTAPGAAACSAIQGTLIHRDITPWLYDIKLSEEARDLANVRPGAGMLSQIRALSDCPLTEAREPKQRTPAVCRHFATMFCAILREPGVPARARCGFGAYFKPGRFEDHWVAEYWDSAQNRWILVDAQLDAVQRETFKPGFDPLDVPPGGFIVAGDAWRQCRNGQAYPNLFGLSFMNEQGLWWVAQNLIRDLAALNRMEMLPWDVWGAMPKPTTEITDSEINLLDRVSEITLAGDAALPDLQEIYQDDRLRVSEAVFNASRQTREKAVL
jgi:Transglutaminase-like superfamily